MGEVILFALGAIAVVTLVLVIITLFMGISGAGTKMRYKYTTNCSYCNYVWEMRRPHTIYNPPSKCPNCGKKLRRESKFIRELEENRKKLNEYRKKYESEYTDKKNEGESV